MPVIDEAAVRRLAAYRPTNGPVTTCYLDIDGRTHLAWAEVEAELERMLRRARAELNGSSTSEADLAAIESYVHGGLDRSNVSGLAIFSCQSEDFWEVVPLSVPVRSRLAVGPTPNVKQLEALLHAYERFGVLLADRQRARVFVYELGELVDHDELFEALPRHDDDGGTWEHQHVQEHAQQAASAHLRHAAAVALEVFQRTGFDHLVVGAPAEIARELESDLHSYLRERLVARIDVVPSASEHEIRQAALAVEEEVERRREGELVDRLRDAVGARNGGVTGLAPTLEALADRRVDTLLVNRGYVTEGWLCSACGTPATIGPSCKRCSGEMAHLDDVVEEAVDQALGSGARVVVCDGNADLDVHGRIGALLRF